MAKLYELASEYRKLADDLESMDGLSKELVVDTLASSTELMSLEEKVTTIVSMVKNWQGDIPAYESEIKRLTSEMNAVKTRIDNVKQYLKECLEYAKLEKVKIGTFTVRIQNNSRGAVIVEDESKVPAAYLDIIPEQHVVSKERLYEDLKAGKEIPGVTYQVGKHIRIS